MFKIAKKDLKLFFQDKAAVLLSFLLPIALITLFALAFGDAGRTISKPKRVTVTDLDQTVKSQEFINKLDSVESIRIEQLSLEEALTKVKKGKRAAVLIFHKGFEDSLNKGGTPELEFKYDEAKQMEVGLLQQALMSNLMGMLGKDYIKSKVIKSVVTDEIDPEIQDTINKYVSKFFTGAEGESFSDGSGFINLSSTKLVGEKVDSHGLVQAVAGTAVMMLLFSVAGMGSSLLEEKEEGTLKKLLYSPINPLDILWGKFIASNFISIVQLLVMFLFAYLAFGLNIFLNIPALLIMIIATAFACSSFGIFLASICKSTKQVNALSTLIILVMSAIGGSMMPTFMMPEWMQQMSAFSVNYWSIQGFYDIYWRQLPMIDILYRAGVLITIGIVISTASTRFFKVNILKLTG
ncbi:ABC transporter permease [Candidatus Amoebophilus asiaticus]|nr:ABC transporter permease [Candidatus Amoebophilus asiaticus]